MKSQKEPNRRSTVALRSIRVQSFKAIKDSGNVGLGSLTLLIGRNGSGKSSLVEALQLLSDSLRSGVAEAISARFGSFEQLRNRRAHSQRVCVDLVLDRGTAQPTTYKLELTSSGVRTESSFRGATSGARWEITTSAHKNGRTTRRIAAKLDVKESDHLALQWVSDSTAPGSDALRKFLIGAVYLRLSPTVLAIPDVIRRSSSSAILGEDGAGVVALLRGLSPDARARVAKQVATIIQNVEEIGVQESGSRGFFFAKERMKAKGGTKPFEIPSWMLSEGTRRLVALFALLEREPRPSMIVIEEIENGLDPWTLQSVMNALRIAASDGVQVLLTTHSPFLLDYVDPSEVLHVRRKDGDTTIVPIESYDNVAKFSGRVRPGAMYVAEFFK